MYGDNKDTVGWGSHKTSDVPNAISGNMGIYSLNITNGRSKLISFSEVMTLI